MKLDEYVENLEPDEEREKRKLAEEKSYEILDYLDDFDNRFEEVKQGDSLFGSTSPSVFVGRSSYPNVPVGILSPVGEEEDADEFATSGDWYQRGLEIENVLQYRTGLLNSRRTAKVDMRDSNRFLDVQREVALADSPVDVEVELAGTPDVDVSLDDLAAPTGPNARATDADLAENPSVPRAVEKAFGDDDWKAQGAVEYLYEKGFDVYEINNIFSAGALGRADERKLVPTRWSITAIDDMVGKHLHDEIKTNTSVDETKVFVNEYIGNRYWVILAPGKWEFELVEVKSPGSVWNPDPSGDTWMGSAYEGFEGRTQYVDETSGAYYASRLGVLEHLHDEGRQAKALVIREVSDEYWAPVGVWQIRESVRNAFDDEGAV
ncbi:MAG: Nre family DNA repair protein, partial [Halobacteria archaeon]|nr:Nre family DNA repair protein [Halobacteria archaeon]